MLPSGIFSFVVEGLEGGETVTNDSADPGGLTKWGISQRAHPAVDIANLTREQALDIYTRDYWHRCRCDELPLGVALMIFDSAVNTGTMAAAKLLQRAVNVSVDGVLGPSTMAAARAMPARDLIEALALGRVDKYLAVNNPTYIKGWLHRVVRVTVRALALAA